jgi:hypothetical protein
MALERLLHHFFVESGFFPREDGWFIPTDEKILSRFPRVKQKWDGDDWSGDWGFLLQKDHQVKYEFLCIYWKRQCKIPGCYCVRPLMEYLEPEEEEEHHDDYDPRDYATDY